MIAVGLDPSLTCTGLAIFDTDGGVTTRRVRTPNLGTSLLARRQRMRRAIDRVLSNVPARVDVTLIEVPNAAKQHGAHQYTLTVVDQPAGKFAVKLRAPSGALALTRSALPADDYDTPFLGTYQVGQLGGPLGELARLLVQEFEQGFTTDPEDVVDAELVDDTTPTTDAEEA
ncbi:hypothetical protein [Microbacterium sp. NPDC089188]|uniref:hypothetical protein n=1 Tax=Microbacterium sp. NPDC089188 TaxID=3154971 RepID=UPI003434BD9D